MAGAGPADEDYWDKSYAKDYEDYILQLSILQLDAADRQVLKIAGGCRWCDSTLYCSVLPLSMRDATV